jgi:elongation factor G
MKRNDQLQRRNIALVGPYSSGKTTLLESLLCVTGSLSRKGTIKDGNTLGDHTPEARNRSMSVEANVASVDYEDIQFTWLDCPGSVELTAETYTALMGVDAAVVVCEPVVERVLSLGPLFQFLDAWEIPHLLFVNKMDRASAPLREVLDALKAVSSRPLVLHQFPIRQNRDLIGFIDLVTEQAYHYHPGAPADPVPLPPELANEEAVARTEMLESLADFDDHLLEELLEEIRPSEAEIVGDLKMELGADLIVPVFFGMAEQDYGIRPLLDALRREAPAPETTAERRGVAAIAAELDPDTPIAQVLKNYSTAQGGKLSLVRLWTGTLTDGMSLNGSRMGGLYQLQGAQQNSLDRAIAGDIVAIARLDEVKAGDTLSPDASVIAPDTLPTANLPAPVFAWAITPDNRSDEVKMTAALNKLIEEDPAIVWEQHGDTHEIILWGQGEIHLQIALDRLRRKYNLPMSGQVPRIPYKETIRKPATHVHGRYKHQSGGHGQFGDVYLDIAPLPRGSGFTFEQKIVGGVVPRQYIPGVEIGVREYLDRGPLGFPVVDVAVTLTDGSYHSVDSSEQAFKQAARLAMQTGLPSCEPTLLEPIDRVTIATPSEFTSKALQAISGRRGQVLGYDARPDWQGWDLVEAYIPHAEIQDLIVELRSQTLGVGTFTWEPDHLQPVPDKIAERVLATSQAAS